MQHLEKHLINTGTQAPTDPTSLQLIFLLSKEHLGRRRLARRTGLSEMVVRLQLERLRDEAFIALNKSGATLSSFGKKQFSLLLTHVRVVQGLSLTTLAQDTVTLAALVSCPAARPPWWYRDHAVSEGASAMILICCCVEGLCFSHSKEQIDIHNPHDEQVIKEAFPFRREGDLLIIVTALDRKRAGLALWQVISEILSEAG